MLSQLMKAAAESEPVRRGAAEKWHDLLLKEDVPALAGHLQQEMRVREAVYGDRVFCPFLRPSMITSAQLEFFSYAAGRIVEAMQTLAPMILNDGKLADIMGITPFERRLMAIDSRYESVSVTSRLDGFLNGGLCGFIEYNAESPAGIGYSDMMTEAFQETGLMKKFASMVPYEACCCLPGLLKALLDCYEEWGGKDHPNIAIIDFSEVKTNHEFVIIKRYFEKQGFKTAIDDPRKLIYKNGRLYSGDMPIDILYRRVLTNEYIEKFDEEQAMFEAFRDGKVCMANSFRSKLLHKKAIFALMSDPEYHKYFTPQTVEAVKLFVPWTRVFAEGKTTDPQGEPCDLAEFALANRESLVIKPNDSYGGRSINLGWEMSPADWEKTVRETLNSGYVVQKRILTEKERFPYWNNDELKWDEFLIDLDPFILNRKLSGVTTRLSTTALCNVTAGGGAAPCIILK
ncbi:MAG: hypothetical protein K6G50_04655 [bacterium]|nr:hypothetical protein [bacterium]